MVRLVPLVPQHTHSEQAPICKCGADLPLPTPQSEVTLPLRSRQQRIGTINRRNIGNFIAKVSFPFYRSGGSSCSVTIKKSIIIKKKNEIFR